MKAVFMVRSIVVARVARVARVASVITTILVVSSAAGAEPLDELGSRGQLIVSADRLSPLFSYARIRQDDGGGDSTTNSTTSMSLLWTGAPQDFYDIPRAGLDYVIAPNITLGGTLFVTLPLSSTRSTTRNGATTSRDDTTTSAFGIGARGGYIAPLTPRISFWGRAGLSYTRVGTTNPGNQGNQGNQEFSSLSQVGLSLEPLFVIRVTSHFGLVLGPVIDLPLSGNQHDEITDNGTTVSTDNSSSQLHFGITAGLLGWL